MIRKITLLFLLCIGLQHVAHAQVADTITISMPYGMDTTCPGLQLNFSAVHSSTLDTVLAYHWYTDTSYTGVSIDSFHTTALIDGDSVFCELVYLNGLGDTDSVASNSITIHRGTSIAPRVAISLTVGNNPGCVGHALTFTALPVNGGDSTKFQWYIDSIPVTGEDSISITRLFANHDTVMCRMISNSPCAAPYNDTAYSSAVIVYHDSVTATIGITATENPICFGKLDSFTAAITNPGAGATIAWYVDSTLVPTAIGNLFSTDSLHNGDLVYAILTAPDACVINHTTISNEVTMTVITLAPTTVWTVLSEGNNPGCLDSSVTFTGYYLNFGTAPVYTWYVNGVEELTGSSTFTHFYANNDIVTYKVYVTDDGCYTADTVVSAPIVMERDSTPARPLLSLISDLLVVNNGGSYIWYRDSTIIPGAVDQTFHPTDLGHYYVVKDSANCPSLPSNIIYISLTGVKNVTKGALVKIYPNPTTGILNMDWGAVVGSMKLDVYNITGQDMLHEEIINQSQHKADLSGLPEGDYFIQLIDGNGNKGTFKIFLAK